MAVKGKGKKKASGAGTAVKKSANGEKKTNGSGGNGDKKKKKSGGKRKSGGGSKSRYNMDIFNPIAMENAYYTCHNIQDVLYCRGFPWPDAQKKKKKGKK
ncbi:small lysine-rich protein 1 [Thrips palmi]|uniref:Small lysine-rich protein 1 n=1 Tax=Thrips palmi TaxID=161013 RepID=A0A6P8ZZ39_THRPL|nr:small lysine-rich protein 1 [Thrips palmi]